MPKSKYIEDHKKDWGIEFANLIGIDHRPEHGEIAAIGCYTMLYHIADNFQDGKYREEILKQFGVE